jgi:hypothetical protein
MSLVVDQYVDLAILHHTDAGVCGSQVYSDDYRKR